ncbi:MAG: isopeptide-forming domain-containing fimbrial protein, partial [bacterium]
AFGDPNPFAGAETATAVAKAMGDWSDNGEFAVAFAKLAYRYRVGDGIACKSGDRVPAGYYLVVDVTAFGADEENTAYNMALLQLTNKDTDPANPDTDVTFDIVSKTSVPELVKKVKDLNDSDHSQDGEWMDSADYDIGDNVVFRLTATLGDVRYYDTYDVLFSDTLSDTLSFNNDVIVKIDNVDKTGDFTVEASGTSLSVYPTNHDVKALGASSNSVITVEYTAKLLDTAVIGGEGNPNYARLSYSNNPNVASSRGKTPEEKVVVYTYSLVLHKVDEEGQALNGATFTLFKKNGVGEYEAISTITGTDFSVFTWNGLDDGDYKIVEVAAPAGFNKLDDIEFTISAEHDDNVADPKLTVLDGGTMFTADLAAGTLTANIVNEAGVTLPETGGSGTTFFYILGSLMLLGGVVLLITKRRMGAAE